MREIIITLTAIALLSACGGSNSSQLEEKRTLRDSLKEVYSNTGKELAEVEEWLTKNDTTIRRNVPLVTTLSVEQKTFEHFFEAHGTAEAKKNAVIYPNAPGNVRGILVSEGQKVSKGQKLLDLDSDILAKQRQEVQANYELARTTFEKQKKLWDQNIGSEIQFLQAKAQMEALEATMATLHEQERMQEIRAPFSGHVDEIFINLGEMASPQMPVVRMVDLGEMHIEADVSESHIANVQEGDPVQVSFPSISVAFNSTIAYKGQFINPGNRSFKIWVEMPKEGGQVLPNALGKVKIRDHVQDSAIVIPTRLIQEDGEGRSFVYAVSNGDGNLKAKKVFVENTLSYQGESLINSESGLKADETLIDEGSRLVVDGQEVRLQEETTETAAK